MCHKYIYIYIIFFMNILKKNQVFGSARLEKLVLLIVIK